MKFNLRLKGSDNVLETDSIIEAASILRIPFTFIMRIGETIERNGWTCMRVA